MTLSQRDRRLDKAFAMSQAITTTLGRQAPGPKRLRELAQEARQVAQMLLDLAEGVAE